tara:strand:+ start:11907 stop:12308 length:402 start_codon:yes stop_codon:yes gene_type:complete
MILQNIFNKLYKVDMAKEEFEKTELATHKIELSNKDAIKFKKEAEQIYYNSKKEAESEILNASSKMKDSYKKLRKLDSEMDKIFEKFDKMAKDLGVDVRSTKVGKTYLEAAEEIQNYQIKSQTAESKLRKFKI